MDLKNLGLSVGKWVVANCERFQGAKNYRLVIMALEDQQSDLVETASALAVKSHAFEDTPELADPSKALTLTRGEISPSELNKNLTARKYPLKSFLLASGLSFSVSSSLGGSVFYGQSASYGVRS